jgi:hypothetical protein
MMGTNCVNTNQLPIDATRAKTVTFQSEDCKSMTQVRLFQPRSLQEGSPIKALIGQVLGQSEGVSTMIADRLSALQKIS